MADRGKGVPGVKHRARQEQTRLDCMLYLERERTISLDCDTTATATAPGHGSRPLATMHIPHRAVRQILKKAAWRHSCCSPPSIDFSSRESLSWLDDLDEREHDC